MEARALSSDARINRNGGGSETICFNTTLYRIFLHFLGLAILMAFNVWAVIHDPPPNGFFCNDESIAYAYKKNETITMKMLIIIVLVSAFLFIVGIESLLWILRRRHNMLVLPEEETANLKCFTANALLCNIYRYIGGITYAFMLALTLTDTAKVTMGRLRPHFLDACKPNWDEIKCLSDDQRWIYVLDYKCSGDPKTVKEARLSFFSGHSSISSVVMVYLLIYLQARLKWNTDIPYLVSHRSFWAALLRSIEVLCPFFQVVFLSLPLFVGLSRILDRYHHVTDVTMGILVGVICAILTGYYIHSWGRLFHSTDSELMSQRTAVSFSAMKNEIS